jgi:hypothetical protein
VPHHGILFHIIESLDATTQLGSAITFNVYINKFARKRKFYGRKASFAKKFMGRLNTSAEKKYIPLKEINDDVCMKTPGPLKGWSFQAYVTGKEVPTDWYSGLWTALGGVETYPTPIAVNPNYRIGSQVYLIKTTIHMQIQMGSSQPSH